MKHLKEMQILNQKRFLRGMAAKMTPYQDQSKRKWFAKGKETFLSKVRDSTNKNERNFG